MKTLLVLASHPKFAEELQPLLDPEHYRLLPRSAAEEAEPLLKNRLVDAALLDLESAQVQGPWLIDKLRRWAPHCPLIVVAGAGPWDWEEEAYVQGAAYVLRKPLRGRLLNALLERVLQTPAPPPPVRPAAARAPGPPAPAPASPAPATQTLGVLRDFTTVLSHSLCAEAMLKEFLLLLREILGVNRAVIFLRRPFGLLGAPPTPEESRRLRSACAVGLSGVVEHFELSFETGIGGFLFRHGRILRADSPETLGDSELLKEFEVLGLEVAIPMLDRDNLIGVAAFAGRVTGEPLANCELELIFHLLEELGLAVKNIWLHDQLVANHEMMANVLRELSSACLVVASDLTILHANKTARACFARAGRRGADLEFGDLPILLGSKIYQVLKTGTGIGEFNYEPPETPGAVYQVTIVPFQRQGAAAPNAALLVVEDHSRELRFQQLEIEAANLRLTKSLADRLAHEIGNALVPLSTHQQLLAAKYADLEFRASLAQALAEGVRRISRLSSQMRFLARDAIADREALPLGELLEEAFREAQSYQPAPAAEFRQECREPQWIVAGDRAALKHALAEILLNALQSNPGEPKVQVHAQIEGRHNGGQWVRLDVCDNGTGFSAEALEKGLQPFFTTRSVGLGLGLTVSRRIIETHAGKLDLLPAKPGQPGGVRITLPLELPTPATPPKAKPGFPG